MTLKLYALAGAAMGLLLLVALWAIAATFTDLVDAFIRLLGG